MYPIIAREQPTRITGPRALILSDKKVALITAMNPTVLGGTVSSWAVMLVYPKVFIIVGRKSENEYNLCHQHYEDIKKQILLLTV